MILSGSVMELKGSGPLPPRTSLPSPLTTRPSISTPVTYLPMSSPKLWPFELGTELSSPPLFAAMLPFQSRIIRATNLPFCGVLVNASVGLNSSLNWPSFVAL